jgi:hypothetical protein
MKEGSYQIILDGTVLDGFDREQVIKKLSGAFKKDTRVIERLMAAGPRPIRRGLDLATARQYQSILSRIGAVSHVRPEEIASATPEPEEVRPAVQQEPDKAPEALPDGAGPTPEPQEHITRSAADTLVCPKCGYAPTSQEDVLLVRGDCPRCGLRVQKDLEIGEDESQEIAYTRRKFRPETIYRDRTPASWDRRTAACLHTFGLFLVVHAIAVLLWIFLFVPVDSIPAQAGTLFLQAALFDWPEVLVCCAVIFVSFILPIFNRGLSWGQRLAEIEVLYTEETKMGGFYLSLALRTTVVLAISLTPGWFLLWLGSWGGWFSVLWKADVVMIFGASLGWLASWVYTYSRPDSRGLADLAAGTLQVEDSPMPRDAFRKAFVPILLVAGCWILLGGVIPLAMKLAR